MTRPCVNHDARARVQALLGAATRAEPRLAVAAAKVMSPIDALIGLHMHAEGTLGEAPWDSLALERKLAPHHAGGLDYRQVNQLVTSMHGEAEFTYPAATALVDLGAAVLLGLALIRLGAPRGLAEDNLRALFGLLIAAEPAETLHRLSGPATGLVDSVAAILQTVRLDGSERQLLGGAVGSLLSDPIERARWRLLSALFMELDSDIGAVSLLDVHQFEDGTLPSSPIPGWIGLQEFLPPPRWSPSRPQAGEALRLVGAEALWISYAPTLVWSAPPRPAGAQSALPFPVELREVDGEVRATAQLPEALEPGWLSLVSPEHAAEVDERRAALRQRWSQLSARALPDCPVPVHQIPAPDPSGPKPPWPLSQPFFGGAPVLEWVEPLPEQVATGQTLQVRWTSLCADAVQLNGASEAWPAQGERTLRAPERAGPWTLELRPSRTQPDGTKRRGRPWSVTLQVHEAEGGPTCP